jgi:hypothetical protein
MTSREAKREAAEARKAYRAMEGVLYFARMSLAEIESCKRADQARIQRRMDRTRRQQQCPVCHAHS